MQTAIQPAYPDMISGTDKTWKAFIASSLTSRGQFRLEETMEKAGTHIEIYRQLSGDTATTLQVGYLKGERLIFIHINNERTPGLNIFETEYFDDDDFSPIETYGGPGLSFSKQNRNGILAQLAQGLDGKEVVYYKEGKLSHAKLTIVHNSRLKNSATFMYYFEKRSLLKRLKSLFVKETAVYQTIEVDLKTVFAGLK